MITSKAPETPARVATPVTATSARCAPGRRDLVDADRAVEAALPGGFDQVGRCQLASATPFVVPRVTTRKLAYQVPGQAR